MPENGNNDMNPVRGNCPMPLSSLPVGGRGIVAEIGCGRRVASRMISLGFTPGVEVTMRQNNGRGSLIVQVRAASVALGRCEAQKILVSPLPA